ncbi:MAG: family 20 glycosylhydrolase [Firmicutes bacterium]|nr:family 20 glycosylhydrolase [Bacillota bacterium]
MKRFEHLSALIECSSGVVPTVEKVKEYLTVLSEMGYDRLYLGMADAYKIMEEPYFNYKRGGYTAEDLREMDDYAKSRSIELIAQIHTLSHLHFLRKYPEYFDLFDTDNILLVGDDRVYVLIEHMVKAISEGLSTRKIHIGLDEAFGIGTGEYLKKFGPADKKDLILRHLKRVLPILRKYGYTCELWGDMLIETDNTKVTAEEVRKNIPEDATVFLWDYVENDESKLGEMIDNMQRHSKHIAFAGAVWKYIGFGPCNRYSIARILPQMKVCYEKGIGHYMVTLWSDNVSRCSVDASLPSLYAAAEYANGKYDGTGELNQEKFYRITGVRYKDMLSLDYVDDPLKTNHGNRSSSSFWAFYTDLLIGNFDLFLTPGIENAYAARAKEFSAMEKGRYEHVFAMSAAVMRVLAVKAPLPALIREAYAEKDRAKAEKAVGEIKKLKETLSCFIEIFDSYFTHDNRPFGLEVNHLYNGGQVSRCDYAIKRLRAFIDHGERIDELEGGVLPINYEPKLTPDCSCMVDYRMLISYCIQ